MSIYGYIRIQLVCLVLSMPIVTSVCAQEYPKWNTFNYSSNEHKLVLSWNLLGDKSSYRLLRRSDTEQGFKELPAITKGSYDDNTVMHGNIYYYVLEQVSGGNVGHRSIEVEISIPRKEELVPPRIVSLKQRSTRDHSIRWPSVEVEWEEIPGAAVYNLYRKASSGPAYELQFSGPELQFRDPRVKIGKTYKYVITAVVIFPLGLPNRMSGGLLDVWCETPFSSEVSISLDQPNKPL